MNYSNIPLNVTCFILYFQELMLLRFNFWFQVLLFGWSFKCFLWVSRSSTTHARLWSMISTFPSQAAKFSFAFSLGGQGGLRVDRSSINRSATLLWIHYFRWAIVASFLNWFQVQRPTWSQYWFFFPQIWKGWILILLQDVPSGQLRLSDGRPYLFLP